MESIEDILNVRRTDGNARAREQDIRAAGRVDPKGKSIKKPAFSLLFFSDVRKDVSDSRKYEFMKDIVQFADREGFEAVYFPERHFYEFGSIYANPAIVSAYLIPLTKRIRFRTAGVSLPLHHPVEVVEWWAMNDILSNGRVDLGFGTGWNKPDFIYSPDNYPERKKVCWERIPVVQKLWRGETVIFPGAGGEDVPVMVYPRPVQEELKVWLLATKNDDSFIHAGKMGYNVFTMLYGLDLEGMREKVALYRTARQRGGHDVTTGTVSLMLHTMVHGDEEIVKEAVEGPFKNYIRSSMEAHVKALYEGKTADPLPSEDEKKKIVEYAYQRYYKSGAIFGTVEEGRRVVDHAIEIGVNEIVCLLDFGVDYDLVKGSMRYLKDLVSVYL
jgi:natural product biosynthesis luciferase-like monooxygenase protein